MKRNQRRRPFIQERSCELYFLIIYSQAYLYFLLRFHDRFPGKNLQTFSFLLLNVLPMLDKRKETFIQILDCQFDPNSIIAFKIEKRKTVSNLSPKQIATRSLLHACSFFCYIFR
ncbi:unnamed protein product [Musa textilis]